MRTFVRTIDTISEWMGQLTSSLTVLLIIVVCFEVTMRYAFNNPTDWVYDTATMMGGTIIALGWAYVHRHHGHIRVDVIYTRLSPRGKAVLDVVLTVLLFFPLMAALTYITAVSLWMAFSMGEVLTESFLYPPAWPIRTLIFLGIVIFALQGVGQFIRDVYCLVRNEPYPEKEPSK